MPEYRRDVPRAIAAPDRSLERRQQRFDHRSCRISKHRANQSAEAGGYLQRAKLSRPFWEEHLRNPD
eukprot:8388894-Alexandrium_andersonii.AAC.1